MKILVTGGSGLLGSNLLRLYVKKHKVWGTYVKNRIRVRGAKLKKLDITDRKTVKKLFEWIKPNLVIHSAAVTDVDYCETNPLITRKVNVRGSINVAEMAESCGARLIHISTDMVFDGKKKGLYKETDKPKPVNVYGKSNLQKN